VPAGETGDFVPHHLDAEWCKTQPFEKPIAHGTLTFAVGVGMTAEPINPVAISYGDDRLRVLKPVHAGDTIRSVGTISAKKGHKSPGFGTVTEHLGVRTIARTPRLRICCGRPQTDVVLLVKRKPRFAYHEVHEAGVAGVDRPRFDLFSECFLA